MPLHIDKKRLFVVRPSIITEFRNRATPLSGPYKIATFERNPSLVSFATYTEENNNVIDFFNPFLEYINLDNKAALPSDIELHETKLVGVNSREDYDNWDLKQIDDYFYDEFQEEIKEKIYRRNYLISLLDKARENEWDKGFKDFEKLVKIHTK